MEARQPDGKGGGVGVGFGDPVAGNAEELLWILQSVVRFREQQQASSKVVLVEGCGQQPWVSLQWACDHMYYVPTSIILVE